jgi:hypothetical protein
VKTEKLLISTLAAQCHPTVCSLMPVSQSAA